MDKFYIGKIVKAQGIKGEIKVQSDTSVLPLIKKLKLFYIDGSAVSVKAIRIDGAFAFVLFSSIGDRNLAEALVGKNLYADSNDIELNSGDYFTNDIVGCKVCLNDGTVLGKVTDLLQNGKSADVIAVSGEREVMFPFLEELVINIDIKGKLIVIDKKRFLEVSVYED